MSASLSAPAPGPAAGPQSLPPAVVQAMAARMGGGAAPPPMRPPMGAGPGAPPGGPPMAAPPGAMPPGAGGPPGMGAPPGAMPPGAGGPPGMGAPPGAQAGPSVPPRLPPPGAQQAGQQGQVDPRLVQAANQIASKGRYGDSIIAHLTPGEVQIPPEILKSNPQLLAAIKTAFQRMGVDISQFTAGSPATTKNPFTGVEENSLFGAILPVLGGVLGSLLLPGVGTAAGMEIGTAGGAAIGGGLGGLAAGAIDHTGPMGMLAGAAGGALGGYAGAGGFGDMFGSTSTGAAGSAAAQGAAVASPAEIPVNTGASDVMSGTGIVPPQFNGPGVVDSGTWNVPTDAAGAVGGQTSAVPKMSIMDAVRGPGLWAGGGYTLGSMLAPPPSSSSTSSTDINKTYPPPTINPNWGQMIGSNAQTNPTFAGYNPFTAVTTPGGGYTFYPTTTPVA